MGRGMASLRGAGQVIYKRLSETGSADLCAQWLDGADRAARDDRAALRGYRTGAWDTRATNAEQRFPGGPTSDRWPAWLGETGPLALFRLVPRAGRDE